MQSPEHTAAAAPQPAWHKTPLRVHPALEGASFAGNESVKAGALGPLALSHLPVLIHVPSSFSSRPALKRCWFFPRCGLQHPSHPSGLRNRRQRLPKYGQSEGREDEQFCGLLTLIRMKLSHPEFPTVPRMMSITQLSRHSRSATVRELGHRGQRQLGNHSESKAPALNSLRSPGVKWSS